MKADITSTALIIKPQIPRKMTVAYQALILFLSLMNETGRRLVSEGLIGYLSHGGMIVTTLRLREAVT